VYGHIMIIMNVPGLDAQTTVLKVLMFSGGVNLLYLGIIGQYLSDIFSDATNRPLYVIQSTEIGCS
jgi:hypothetical protein